MNERDKLLAQLKDLRAQAEEITERADEILEEEVPEQRRRHWTPVIIRGGLAGTAAAWLSGAIRGALQQHPIVTVSVTLASAGATLGVILSPAVTRAPQATPSEPEWPPIVRTPTSTGTLPTLPTTAPTPRVPAMLTPTVTTTSTSERLAGRGERLADLGQPSVSTAIELPPITGPSSKPLAPDPLAPCVIRVDALDIADQCISRRTEQLGLSVGLDVEGA